MSEARLQAFKALSTWLSSEKYIDHILESHRTKLGDRDRRFLDNLVNGSVMMHRQLDHIIGRYKKSRAPLHNSVRIIAWMGVYELLHMGGSKDYASVHSLINLAKKITPRSAGFLNALFRKIISFRDSAEWSGFLSNQKIPPGVRYSFPDWLVMRWRQQFADSWESLLATLNSDALKMVYVFDPDHRDDVMEEFSRLELSPGANPYHPAFIHVSSLQPLLNHELLQKGRISIQDVSTLFPVKLLLQEHPASITDVCAAPGGKLTLLRSLIPQAIPVTACDISPFRLKIVEKNLQRLNLGSVNLLEADASAHSFPRSSHFLVDAPCSGFGVIRKRSDLRWRRQPGDVKDLTALQLRILDNVSRSVKKGGILVYSTCTFDRDENMGLIEKFLAEHPRFSYAGVPPGFPRTLIHEGKAVMTLPHLHAAEGSFAIALKKV